MGIPSRQSSALVNQIRKSSFLAEVGNEEINRFVEFAKSCILHPGAEIFQQNQPCSFVYLLTEGKVRLYRTSALGQERTIDFISAGELFGEAGMFSGTGYPFSSATSEGGEAIAFDAFRFNRVLYSRPDLTLKMLSSVSRQLVRMFDRVDALKGRCATSKVAFYLLHADRQSREGWLVDLPFRRSDLANLLGIQAETLCRILAKFRKQGWVKAEGPRLRISDAAALHTLLNDKEAR